VQKLIAVIRKFKYIETIEICWKFLARVVKEVERMFSVTSYSSVEEIAILSKHDLIQRVDADYVHDYLESSLTKHLRFSMSLL
jgi:hypothetical protein